MIDPNSAVRELHDALGQALAQRDEAIRANQVLVTQLADLEHEHLQVCEALVYLKDSTNSLATGHVIHTLVERIATLRQALTNVMDAGSAEDAICAASDALDKDGDAEDVDEVRFPTEGVEALSESVVAALLGVESDELDDPFNEFAPDMCGSIGDPRDPTSPLCMRKPDHDGPHQTIGVVNIETDPSTTDGENPAVVTAKAIKKSRKKALPKSDP